ncbi:MAG: phosphogluconate dehydratase [Gammaproteobacteria bacterium]|nr:phosphogluconate dehydratase [Gammaproteobacteria bacterium]
MHSVIEQVTEAVSQRSAESRQQYLDKIYRAAQDGPGRNQMPCSNFAHGIAACSSANKSRLQDPSVTNIGIVSAYNDMLSAHQPYEQYPAQIRAFAEELGAVAQFAGGVPAMCDGVTQGQDGMDLSLFSRDVIALSTAVALSHNMFNGVACLGICDKIVPGLMIGSLAFGHLPTIFIPAGPMPSGLGNKEKAKVREAFAAGEASRGDLLAAESAAYHSPGTCTFYGTANTNQMLMEFMGLQLPGSSFINPRTELREALTREAVRQLVANAEEGELLHGRNVDEKVVINGIIGLLATGGSSNHTLHLVAIARAAGIKILWEDFAALSEVIPLMTRVYPNGVADVNHFNAAGGLAFIIRDLLAEGLLHDDVATIVGKGMEKYTHVPSLDIDKVAWRPVETTSGDYSVLRSVKEAFHPTGGLQLVTGNLGKAIIKTSAVEEKFRKIKAPAKVFASQKAVLESFYAGELEQDMVLVLIHQGPMANGMPELHKLTPCLGVLQNRGFKVALLTDGRMSGASGKVLSAIHVSPEAHAGGNIGLIKDGDMITIDAMGGSFGVEADLDARQTSADKVMQPTEGMGRELFSVFRNQVASAEEGASIFFSEE